MFDDILNAMKSIAIVFSLILSSLWVSPPARAAEQTVAVVGAEFWAMPRHAEQLLALAPLTAAVQQLMQEPEAYLVLNYPASEFGELWGLEFQAWLVSLGIVSDRVELRAGYEGADGIAVILVMPAATEALSFPPPLSIEQGVDEGAPGEQTVKENSSVEGAAATVVAPVEDEVESQ